jgi:hypothetical protein
MLWILLFIVVTGGVAWIAGLRSRRRMGRALGRKVQSSELTSINTWMAVEAAEKGSEGPAAPGEV